MGFSSWRLNTLMFTYRCTGPRDVQTHKAIPEMLLCWALLLSQTRPGKSPARAFSPRVWPCELVSQNMIQSLLFPVPHRLGSVPCSKICSRKAFLLEYLKLRPVLYHAIILHVSEIKESQSEADVELGIIFTAYNFQIMPNVTTGQWQQRVSLFTHSSSNSAECCHFPSP